MSYTGTFSVMGERVAIGAHAKETRVAYAPTPPLATRLAKPGGG